MLKFKKEVQDAEFEEVETTTEETEMKEEENMKEKHTKRKVLIGLGILGAVVTTALGITSARKSREDAIAMLALSGGDSEEETDEDSENSEDKTEETTEE